MSMKNDRNFWAGHVAAIKSQGGSTSAYARQHGISLGALYYWQRKLELEEMPRTAALTTPKPPGKFVALRVNDVVPVVEPASWGCTLVLTGGMRLEMSALPDPQWLAAVDRANQGGH